MHFVTPKNDSSRTNCLLLANGAVVQPLGPLFEPLNQLWCLPPNLQGAKYIHSSAEIRHSTGKGPSSPDWLYPYT